MGTETSSAQLEVNNLSKKYGDVQIFKDVSFEVKEGEVFSIIGRSGAGKTTVLRCINLLEDYEAGEIIIEDEHIGYRVDGQRRRKFNGKTLARQRQYTGMVFQHFNLYPHMTALRNVSFGLHRVGGRTKQEADNEAMEWLDAVGLADRSETMPAHLSGGQQQRVGIARAVALQPRILLLDEVTSALDPELVTEVLEVIRGLANQGMTMVIVTHEMRFAYELSDRAAFMSDGGISVIGTAEDIFRDSQDTQLRNFLANFQI